MTDLNELENRLNLLRRQQDRQLDSASSWLQSAAETDAAVKELERQLAEAKRPPTPDSDYVAFKKRFNKSDRRVYSYVAMRLQTAPAVNRKWFLSGSQNLSFNSWPALLNWLGEDNWGSIQVLVPDLPEVDEEDLDEDWEILMTNPDERADY